MKRPTPDSDETVLLRPSQPARRPKNQVVSKVSAGIGVGLVIVTVAVTVGWMVRPSSAPPPAQVALPAPGPVIETATVGQILTHEPTGVSFIRLAENPHVVVLDFASLEQQSHMLDRIAALIEKTDLPKDHILNTQELAVAVKADGASESGFYYGHDYSAASLRLFFATADRDNVQLNEDEVILRNFLDRLGWLDPGAVDGLISIPHVAADNTITAATRDVVFKHELSHGEYFSNPAYAAYVHSFFLNVLTKNEQQAFRVFLGHDGYDTGNAELVENETQAYLFFTVDPQFFSAAQVNMTQSRRDELRALFLRGMDEGWLKNLLAGL